MFTSEVESYNSSRPIKIDVSKKRSLEKSARKTKGRRMTSNKSKVDRTEGLAAAFGDLYICKIPAEGLSHEERKGRAYRRAEAGKYFRLRGGGVYPL